MILTFYFDVLCLNWRVHISVMTQFSSMLWEGSGEWPLGPASAGEDPGEGPASTLSHYLHVYFMTSLFFRLNLYSSEVREYFEITLYMFY